MIKNSSVNSCFTADFRLSKIGILGNYVESQWALATFTVPPECACICAFSSQNNVVGTSVIILLCIVFRGHEMLQKIVYNFGLVL